MNENTADILKKNNGKLGHAILSKTHLVISIIIGIALSVTVAIVVYLVQIETADTNEEIERVKIQVRDLTSKVNSGTITSEDEISEEIRWIGFIEGADLSDHNREIAQAKFYVKETDANSFERVLAELYVNPDTIKKSKKPYRTKRRITTTAILVGVFSPILTIPLSLLVLFIISVIWYFVLDRINEISTAIQGKR